MAPFPENDNTPKAPDKCDKQKCEKSTCDNVREPNKDEKTLSNLNDGELKALLDEAITYKNPKDREGKSKLFKDLLIQAEETERIARAASAGGSELVRHCNPSARRGGRHRRKPASVSENVMHGGSLDNLAKEELFESAHHLTRTRKSVSARAREGGSLPCNVNSSVTPSQNYQFLEEAKRNKAMKDKEYTAIDMETESLLENDHLAQSYQEQVPPIEMVQAGQFPKFTSKATLQIDDPIGLDLDGTGESKKPYDVEALQRNVMHSKYQVFIPTYKSREPDEKKVDENGNALHQTKTKKKKIQTDKNVVVLTAESVEGHRSEIINDVNKLMQYIEGTDNLPSKSKSNLHKSKQLHKQHTSEDGGRTKKQRAHSSKGKDGRGELKKSNSLGEISTAKLDEFAFASDSGGKEEKVVLRNNKSQNDRPRERRSWGNVEPPPFQSLYSNASVENLETSDNWVVTKPKKKSKKRRNSISSGRRQHSNLETNAKHITTRAPSPDLRGKSACSMPHSEKSNDSSDVDSVHSLPIDGPISYADIAKNSEKSKEKKISPEKVEKVPNVKEKSPVPKVDTEVKIESKQIQPQINNVLDKNVINNNVKNVPPDVHNFKSFPAITSNSKVQSEKTIKIVNNNAANNKNKSNSPPSSKSIKINNKDVKSNVCNAVAATTTTPPTQLSCVHQNNSDIQTDLSIIQANEMDSIQFNSQMLPPDIPDVQTIEKMHFMNFQPVHPSTTPQQPPFNTPLNTHSIHQISPSEREAQLQANNINNSEVCDNNERTNIEDSTEGSIEEDEQPPVVILSGINNKEVSGLVFGFDINEQLLKDEICENFVARYMAPEVFSQSSHNHDKIVNFIGQAWESIINQSNVSYYSEEL